MRSFCRMIVCTLILTLLFSSCKYESQDYDKIVSLYEEELHELEMKYEEKISQLNNDINSYDDELGELGNYEKAISHYEMLLEELSLITYDQSHYPEKWRFYAVEDTNIIHTDWLCVNFSHNCVYFSTAFPELLEAYSPCKHCYSDEYIYLDLENRVFHTQRDCLNFATELALPNTDYEFASYSSAVESEYAPCKSCFK